MRTMCFILIGAIASAAGCVTESTSDTRSASGSRTSARPASRPAAPATPGAQRSEDVDLSTAFSGLPRALERTSGGVVAEIAAFSGDLPYDAQTMPLVDPAGQFLAVQQGVPVSWPTALARPDALPLDVSSSLAIYSISPDADQKSFRLTQTHWFEQTGILGRSADKEGFLVEAPQADGSRWVGKVIWSTGEVRWVVKGDRVNAHAALEVREQGEAGRLAWCSRAVDGENFDLMVQGDAEVYSLPAESGSWLYPVWCRDGERLFAFFLSDDGRLDIVALDARTSASLRRPLARQTLVMSASDATAYQMLAGVQQPAAPDGSLRMLFFHSGLGRACVFDPLGKSTRGDGGVAASVLALKKGSIGGGWYDDKSVVLNGISEVSFQVLPRESLPQDPTTLLETKEKRKAAVKDPGGLTDQISVFARSIARPTSDERMPFILFAPSPKQASFLRVGALHLLDARVLKPVQASR